MIQIETVQTRVTELEELWKLKQAASESYTAGIEMVAAAAHCEPSALKAYINARMRDKVEKLEREHEQLSLMLEITQEAT